MSMRTITILMENGKDNPIVKTRKNQRTDQAHIGQFLFSSDQLSIERKTPMRKNSGGGRPRSFKGFQHSIDTARSLLLKDI